MVVSALGGGWSKSQFCVGVLQLATWFPFFVGWIWSGFWGFKILTTPDKAGGKDSTQKKGYDMSNIGGGPKNPFEDK